MARKRDPKRDEAFKLFIAQKGNISNREIARVLDVDEKKIAVWKGRDKWAEQLTGEKRCTTKRNNTTNIRSKRKKEIIDALIEAGTYSPALDFLIEIYLDCYEEYQVNKTEKLRKELAKYLGQLGLDGKNKELIKKSGVLLEKEEDVEEKGDVPQSNKLIQFRQRMSR
jgi:hypothetical protein